MSGRETKHLKALYFDLYVKKLEENFSKTKTTVG